MFKSFIMIWIIPAGILAHLNGDRGVIVFLTLLRQFTRKYSARLSEVFFTSEQDFRKIHNMKGPDGRMEQVKLDHCRIKTAASSVIRQILIQKLTLAAGGMMPGTTINNSKSENIIIFPNPTSGKTMILMPDIAEKLDVELKNILGQSVYRQSFYGKKEIEILPEALSGLYFLELSQNNTLKIVKLIIKQ